MGNCPLFIMTLITQDELDKIAETHPYMVHGSRYDCALCYKNEPYVMSDIKRLTDGSYPSDFIDIDNYRLPKWYQELDFGEGVIKTADLLKYPEVGDVVKSEHWEGTRVVSSNDGKVITLEDWHGSWTMSLSKYKSQKIGKFAESVTDERQRVLSMAKDSDWMITDRFPVVGDYISNPVYKNGEKFKVIGVDNTSFTILTYENRNTTRSRPIWKDSFFSTGWYIAEPVKLTNAERLGLPESTIGLSVDECGLVRYHCMLESIKLIDENGKFNEDISNYLTHYSDGVDIRSGKIYLLPKSFLDSRLEFYPIDSIELLDLPCRESLEKQVVEKMASKAKTMSYDEMVAYLGDDLEMD